VARRYFGVPSGAYGSNPRPQATADAPHVRAEFVQQIRLRLVEQSPCTGLGEASRTNGMAGPMDGGCIRRGGREEAGVGGPYSTRRRVRSHRTSRRVPDPSEQWTRQHRTVAEIFTRDDAASEFSAVPDNAAAEGPAIAESIRRGSRVPAGGLPHGVVQCGIYREQSEPLRTVGAMEVVRPAIRGGERLNQSFLRKATSGTNQQQRQAEPGD
jgi:hypothetical protein